MSQKNFEQAMTDLGLQNDPTMRAVMSLLYASDNAHKRNVNEELARIGRMTAALDRVPERDK